MVMCELIKKPCIYQAPDDPDCNYFCPVYTASSLSQRREARKSIEQKKNKRNKDKNLEAI